MVILSIPSLRGEIYQRSQIIFVRLSSGYGVQTTYQPAPSNLSYPGQVPGRYPSGYRN